VDRLIDELEALITREGPQTIAAFFTEPVLAAGGIVVPPVDYFARLQAVLARYDILLVCDEVVTGFGRIGDMFGTTAMSLKPDMIVCAKGITSAYLPLSALMVSERIFEAMVRQSDEVGVFGLTMTYSGHPVAAAVAREAIRIYEEERIPSRVRRLELQFLGGLGELAAHPLVGDVRGKGLLAGVELVSNKETRIPFDRKQGVGTLCTAHAETQGLIVRAIGDTIAFCPPLVINEEEIAELLCRFRRALDATMADLARG
jgi:4-aminobutyrate--pyruvate transaminase